MAMALTQWPGSVGALLAFSAMLSAVGAGPSAAGPCAVRRVSSGGAVLRLSGGDDGERLLRMSGGREYGDDDYDGGATVSLAAVAQEARERERETTTSNNAAAESAAARAGGGGGGEKGTGSGNGGRGSGALLSADAFRKQHDISFRKLGSRAGCEQLEPLQSFGKVLDTYYLNILICPSLHRHRPTPNIHQYIYIYRHEILIYHFIFKSIFLTLRTREVCGGGARRSRRAGWLSVRAAHCTVCGLFAM